MSLLGNPTSCIGCFTKNLWRSSVHGGETVANVMTWRRRTKIIFIFDNFLEATRFLHRYFCAESSRKGSSQKNYILNRSLNRSAE